MSGIPELVLNLTVHHLIFTVEAGTFVHLGPQAGAQIRGALWAALKEFACTSPNARTPEHTRHCPMCRLVALETADNSRGVNPPRPFAIRPPLPDFPGGDCRFKPGQTFSIGINLFGDAADLFPFVAQAMYRAGQLGIGYGRGQFGIRAIQAVNPCSAETRALFDGRRVNALPDVPVNHAAVVQAAAALPADRLRLNFLTQTHLTGGGRVVNKPDFAILLGRLIERCQALEAHYTDAAQPAEHWRAYYLHLVEQSRSMRLVQDDTRWVRVESGSRRTNETVSVSGFVGAAVYQGDLAAFRYWLAWGQSLHIGKNAVKGSGWYSIEN